MRVYVCDDSPEHRALVRAVLGEAAEIAGEAADGRTCLDELDATQPDVLVLDLQMPGMTGFEVLDELRRRDDPPRVLVLTSSPPGEVGERVRAAGADYLRKGESPDVLRDAVLGRNGRGTT
jgi:CheY-like chemotaxis protein